MESSILISTKKILGVSNSYTAFDLDITTHINAALSTARQLGLPLAFESITDNLSKWEDLGLVESQLNMLKTYVYLKTGMWFDPPTTSFLIEAKQDQIEQLEWRMNVSREEIDHPLTLEGEIL